MILNQPVWNNSLILVDNGPVCYPHWKRKGVIFVNDLLEQDGSFLTFDRFIDIFHIATNFLEYYGIIAAIKSTWRRFLINLGHKFDNPINSFVNIILCNDSLKCRSIYDKIINSRDTDNKTFLKWSETINISENSWSLYCSIPFRCTSDVQMRWFQYRLINIIIPTNKYLMIINVSDSNRCTFCDVEVETIQHLFYDCHFTNQLWRYLHNIFHSKDIRVDLQDVRTVLFGGDFSRELKLIIVLVKYFIFRSKLVKRYPTTVLLLQYLREYFEMYYYIFRKNMKVNIWERYWRPWVNVLALGI